MLYAATLDDNTVIEFAWKDAQVVLFISTVADGKQLNYLDSIEILLMLYVTSSREGASREEASSHYSYRSSPNAQDLWRRGTQMALDSVLYRLLQPLHERRGYS
jgi:hypothetical protein